MKWKHSYRNDQSTKKYSSFKTTLIPHNYCEVENKVMLGFHIDNIYVVNDGQILPTLSWNSHWYKVCIIESGPIFIFIRGRIYSKASTLIRKTLLWPWWSLRHLDILMTFYLSTMYVDSIYMYTADLGITKRSQSLFLYLCWRHTNNVMTNGMISISPSSTSFICVAISHYHLHIMFTFLSWFNMGKHDLHMIIFF
jgi:hypothetical protein